MGHRECDCIPEESSPGGQQAHTDKPAVIALLHDADEIALLQLQLVFVLRRVTVKRLETGERNRPVHETQHSEPLMK